MRYLIMIFARSGAKSATAKAAPNLSGVIDGQVLQWPLSDASELNMNVVGMQLAADGLAKTQLDLESVAVEFKHLQRLGAVSVDSRNMVPRTG